MAQKLRVGVIFGGRSGEHEVSLLSAGTVMEALDSEKYQVVPIGIAKDGTWLVSGDPMKLLGEAAEGDISAAGASVTRHLLPISCVDVLEQGPIDVAIPMVHGTFGEDGCLQGLLDLAQIPYVGAGVLASAVGMDKGVMKDVFRQHEIPVVEWRVVTRKRWREHAEEVTSAIEEDIGYPCFVKPANLGSSVGISKIHRRFELPDAMEDALQYDRRVIVERAVDGCREIEVSVLGNDDPIASVPGEIVPANEFYDYEAKYLDVGSQLLIPAPLSSEAIREVQRLAIEAYVAVDCAGMGRVDCFVSRQSGAIYVNEINTIPGFTRISMYPKLWEATGIGMTELLDRLIDLAIERHQERQSSRTSYR